MNTAFCFGLDYTLTDRDLLPIVSRVVGAEKEIEILVSAANNGVLSFEKVLNLVIKILQSTPTNSITHEIQNHLRVDPIILNFIEKNIGHTYILTPHLDIWTTPIVRGIGIRCFTALAKVDDKCCPIGVKEYFDASKVVAKLRTQHDRIVAIGSQTNDLTMFECSDISVVYGERSSPDQELLKISDFATFEGGTLCRLLNTL